MSEIYTNEVGKSRPVEEKSREESQLRQRWFAAFEEKLRLMYPELTQDVSFQIVGSVSKNMASSSSDIDIVIKTGSSDELRIAQVRNAIFTLLEQMEQRGEQVYPIEVQQAGNPLMFGAVATFRRKK